MFVRPSVCLTIGGTYVYLIEGGTNVGGTNVGGTFVGGRKVAASHKCKYHSWKLIFSQCTTMVDFNRTENILLFDVRHDVSQGKKLEILLNVSLSKMFDLF